MIDMTHDTKNRSPLNVEALVAVCDAGVYLERLLRQGAITHEEYQRIDGRLAAAYEAIMR